MEINENTQLGTIVADDYRSAKVFSSFGLDFCCGGKTSIADACSKKNIEAKDVINGVVDACKDVTDTSLASFANWKLSAQIDYIIERHHSYVLGQVPQLKAYLHKVANVHGENHPELIEVFNIFNDVSDELMSHMNKEEVMLFPKIKSNEALTPLENSPSVSHMVAAMESEHTHAGGEFEQLSALTNNFTPPEDACTTYRVAFTMLKAFEEDLHMHIHLENNVLFPQAMEVEQKMIQTA